MKPLANMFPVSVLATDICGNFGDTDRKFYGEHLKNIINVYKFLHIFLLKNISVKSITLSPDGLHDLPCDFVRETKIGIINSEGRIATMRVDKNLRVACKTDSQVQAALCAINDNTAPDTCFSFYNVHDQQGGFVGELRGRACTLNNIGYFNVDRENGVLIAKNSLKIEGGHNIIFEYISDGISDGLQVVPTELTDCLTNGAKARFCLDKKDNRYEIFQHRHETDFKNIKNLYTAQRIDVYAQLFKTID